MGDLKKKPEVEGILCSIPVYITEKNNLPCIELRKCITNSELIKSVISCAFHERAIVILPSFNDKIKSINNLIEKGILYRKNNEFYFTF